jgi:hypothetical protein
MMQENGPLVSSNGIAELPSDQHERHQALVDFFGQFIFWLRNKSLRASQELVESVEARARLGIIRRDYYEGVANLSAEQRNAAMLLAEETLDGFIERLLWSLGDEGTDARFGIRDAYHFLVEMEIVEIESGSIIHQEPINRGGKFFGKNWGKWRNRYGKWRDEIGESH